ncbi:hypothetical protein [Hyphococcus sp.]|uniref:hypothetical protein n=1 Tax=Hyphococcus sp. TaxID=2038636 RepID=UPI003D09C982
MKLDIVTAGENAIAPNYMIEGMLGLWREAGHDILIRPLGRMSRTPDLIIAHVDRTFVDEALMARERAAAPVVNGAVTDISKRTISAARVSQDDDYTGAVMVKSNLNFHGAAERRARALHIRAADSLWRLIKSVLPSGWTRESLHYRYPIYDRKADMPAWIWNDQNYVVERFLPERDGEFYVTRSWVFFGDRDHVRLSRSYSPIVKSQSTVSHEQLDAAPPELVEMRRKLGFDYGKFDYVEHEGRAVLLDANKTPTMTGRTPRHMDLLSHFAGGLAEFAPKQRADEAAS